MDLNPDLISKEEAFEDGLFNLEQIFIKKVESELAIRIAEAFKIPKEKIKPLEETFKKLYNQSVIQMNRLRPVFDTNYFEEFRGEVYHNYLDEVLDNLSKEKENSKKFCFACERILEFRMRDIILLNCDLGYELGRKDCLFFSYAKEMDNTIYMHSLKKRIEVVTTFLYNIEGVPLH